MVNKPALTSTTTSETAGVKDNIQQLMTRRGSKRARQNINSRSGESAGLEPESGTNLKDMPENMSKKSVSPGEPDEMPDAGRPGSSGRGKAEVEPVGQKNATLSPDNEPLNIRGKETCKSGKPRRGTQKNLLKRSTNNILADAARGKRKERSEKPYEPSATSISAGNSVASGDRKRVKTVLKESATEDSFDALLLKIEEAYEAKVTSPDDAGPSSRHKGKHDSKQSSKETESGSKSSISRKPSEKSSAKSSPKSSAKSSGRSSLQSMESMDGHTELLESLVHAAHAEDKLRSEKEDLQQRNDILEKELLYALKVVDKLRTKCKHASRIRHERERKLLAEKTRLEKELKAKLKQEQIASKKDKSAPAQKRW